MSQKIMVVEDSPTQARAIVNYLTSLGLETIMTDDGPPAIKAVMETHPDAVILDVNLPTMSGYQIARRLKRSPACADIPIIMLTSLDNTNDMIAGLDNGADYFITKGPHAVEELWKTLAGFGLIALGNH